MKNSFKYMLSISLLLIIGCAGFAVSAAAGGPTTILYEGMEAEEKPLRLHILANSDSAEDQQLKLALRDHIISYLSDITDTATSKQQAMEGLEQALPQLQESCQAFISLYSDYSVTASIEVAEFPPIDYNGTVFAAGQYDALRIVIGEGKGHNWWCVLFPPLCFVDLATELDEEALLAVSTGSDKVAESKGYSIGFKFLNWLDELKQD